jgi:hypothetical protein
MPLSDRIRSILGGAAATEVMSVTGPEPCEDCGATPADDLVGVRWLCATCAPAARREERAADGGDASRPAPPEGTAPADGD